ncbi:AMP-binding protein [Chitinimonas arctica]|uniref:AMP-binding protein n=1 Tax=Chitinimonas arctica TaxID=2594795 RepID=A0A516SIC9_9NEIS|nr:AMP-binding protein [Chitinimonas arctica]QDQ27798.1 AMP-binding protein [Chitinimonas arctica]
MAEWRELAHLLAEGRPADHPVALRDGAIHDFAAFTSSALAWRRCFAAQAGRRFALYCEDSADFAAALFGAWHAGKVVYLPGDTVAATLRQLAERVDGFAGDLPAHCQPLRPAAPARDDSAMDWQVLDVQSEALVVFTSGSTGLPSAIPKRLCQLFEEVATLSACFGARLEGANVLATVSHQHIYGLLFRVLLPLAAGQPFAAKRLAFSEDIATALARSGPSVLVASPAHLKRLPPAQDWAAGRLGLRALFCSGGPLPVEALPDCRALLGQAPIEVFGSSETGGIAWRRRDRDEDTHWQALPGVRLRIENQCLWVRSPHLSDDNWQATADQAEMDAAGLRLLGRADRIVKVEEKRVSLDALEHALLAGGLLLEAKALLLPGTRAALAVVAVPNEAGWALHDDSGKRALNEALRGALAGVLEHAILPRRWRYHWDLPTNSQGKSKLAALAALFDPRRPAARLLARRPDAARLRFEVAANSPYFAGHFPGAPVLPGVAQLQWVQLFAGELLDVPLGFQRMEAVKFPRLLPPGSTVTLELSLRQAQAGEEGVLAFKLSSAAGIHASGRMVFGALS